jgi:hypothetical protein
VTVRLLQPRGPALDGAVDEERHRRHPPAAPGLPLQLHEPGRVGARHAPRGQPQPYRALAAQPAGAGRADRAFELGLDAMLGLMLRARRRP